MKTKVRKRSGLEIIRGHLLSIVFFVVIFALFLAGVSSAENNSAHEGKKILEDNINRAIISCYAIEGAYPQSLDYLVDNYDLQIDESRYQVTYIPFAANIMPDVTVFDLKEAKEKFDNGDAVFPEEKATSGGEMQLINDSTNNQ